MHASPQAISTSLRATVSVAAPDIESKTHRGTQSQVARHFLGIGDLSALELSDVLDAAATLKENKVAGANERIRPLTGTSVVMLFEKPSLRTRVSFESGIVSLGGHPIYFDHGASRIGARESLKDYARNLERYVSVIIARVHEHATVAGLAEHANVPVINALSELEHPCQALADMLTLREVCGPLPGLKLAWVGDGNNVCHSLMLAAAALGVHMTVVTPHGFEPRFEVIRQAGRLGTVSGAKLSVGHDLDSIAGHHAVYTDAWVSMGQDSQTKFRKERFAGLQVDTDVMTLASTGLPKPAKFMHCLPAHRGEEVTDEVIDSADSVVYQQAENRMHAQNALLLSLLEKCGTGFSGIESDMS